MVLWCSSQIVKLGRFLWWRVSDEDDAEDDELMLRGRFLVSAVSTSSSLSPLGSIIVLGRSLLYALKGELLASRAEADEGRDLDLDFPPVLASPRSGGLLPAATLSYIVRRDGAKSSEDPTKTQNKHVRLECS